MEKIAYSIVLKNKNRASAKWYGRIRQPGKPEKLVPIGPDKAQAERWLRRVQLAYDEACDLEAHHEPVPPEISEAILTVDSTPVVARQRGSEAVLTLREAVERWEAHMRLIGRSEKTIAQYMRTCREIFDLSRPVTSFDKACVDAIMARKAGLKSSSRRHVAEMLKVLAQYCVFEFGLPATLMQAIPTIKAVQDELPCWTMKDMKAIIQAVVHPNESVRKQFQLYLKTLAQTGCRQGEGADIRWEDVNLDYSITFPASHTKTRTTRVVPIPKTLYDELMLWHRPSGLVFDLIPRTQSGRYSLLKKALDKVGLSGSLHCFRRTASTMMYFSSGDLKGVSQLLGHNPATALRYYQRTRRVDELRRIVERNNLGEV